LFSFSAVFEVNAKIIAKQATVNIIGRMFVFIREWLFFFDINGRALAGGLFTALRLKNRLL